MKRRPLLWQLYPTYLLIIAIVLIAVALYASRTLKQFYLGQIEAELLSHARLFREQIESDVFASDSSRIEALCKAFRTTSGSRITVIDRDGVVRGDSEEDPERMDNHADRPEVKAALSGRAGTSTRFSYTLEKRMMYVAIPFNAPGRSAGVIRAAIPVTAIDAVLGSVYRRIAAMGIIIALFAAGMSLVLSRLISRPLVELKQGAERFAHGDLKIRLPVSNSEEIGALAEAMNHMAFELDSRIQTIVRQKSREEVILSSMIEGVFAVDRDERIIMLNQAAALMFDIDTKQAEGRSLQEVVRNTDLQKFVSDALATESVVEAGLVLRRNRRILQANGSALKDQEGKRMGALIVLHDVTQIRKLEQVRKDFVANVSHELRTPITSIQGFVETLQQGALQDRPEAERFLEIVAKHTDRLNAIIEDLLLLSRIEQESDREEIELQEGDICPVLEAAAESCRVSADMRDITINIECGAPCRARLNTPLLEQAVINLLENAIKYSKPGSSVEVRGESDQAGVTISVRDHGCGIGSEHLSRIFERFYRVDKARSRKLGGTGLGLSIAKHIVLAHGGRIDVESIVDAGSVFRIRLPGV